MSETNDKLFIIDLHYVVPLEEIDALIPGHLDYLDRGYADGVFLTSGRKIPRTGGVILATCASRQDLELRIASDPFVSKAAAEVTITEMQPSRVIPDVGHALQRLVS